MLGCFNFMNHEVKQETQFVMAGIAYMQSEGTLSPLVEEYMFEIFDAVNRGRLILSDKTSFDAYAAAIKRNQKLVKSKEAQRKFSLDDEDFTIKYPTSHTYVEEGFKRVELDFDLQCSVKQFLSLRDKILEREHQDILVILRECYLAESPSNPCPATKLEKLSRKYRKLEDVLCDLLSAGVPMSEVFPEAFE